MGGVGLEGSTADCDGLDMGQAHKSRCGRQAGKAHLMAVRRGSSGSSEDCPCRGVRVLNHFRNLVLASRVVPPRVLPSVTPMLTAAAPAKAAADGPPAQASS